MALNERISQWRPNAQVFWGEIAPREHAVQIYDDEAAFLECLVGFIGSGLACGESVIVIASRPHLDAIASSAIGGDLLAAETSGRYVTLDARDALARFMVDGSPDECRFMSLIEGLLRKARGPSERKVRAFGEMVALLWEQGQIETTLRLEQLWNEFCQKTDLCLFCAYPRAGLAENEHGSVGQICAAHSRIIAA